MGRTFNRKLKQRDTFTNIFGGYTHEPATCYTKSAAHVLHPNYKLSVDAGPAHRIDRTFTHKYDDNKEF